MFHDLLQCFRLAISKNNMNYQKAIELGLRLALTLRHLATGESYHSLRFGFRVPHNTYSVIVRQVCEAIVDEFADELIKLRECSAMHCTDEYHPNFLIFLVKQGVIFG